MNDDPVASNDVSRMVTDLQSLRETISHEVGKVIVGQQEVLEQILVSLFSGGHVLLVGVPGLAKTLLIRTLAESLKLDFRRIQFTPDLMPSDITGTEVIEQDVATGKRELKFIRGPVFANVVLADEINRTPPKTQAALLEAMQENQVTVGGMAYRLDQPFMVLATQNPIEQEGTYSLPEALLDRFMMQILIRYPNEGDELEIVRRTTSRGRPQVTASLTGEAILGITDAVKQMPIADHVALYAIRLCRLTRSQLEEPQGWAFVPAAQASRFSELQAFVQTYVRWGAGPRASQFLVLAGKTRAALYGRDCVSHEDIRRMACPVLRHRLRTNFQATADNVTADQIVLRLIEFLDHLDDHENAIDSKFFGSPRTG